ncbi:MAG TPA: tRNA preQ1(34) S-adenosylmethionine ribosyltransferase-isomerase QueA [Bacilli bacterium]|nr:tRNA preQ1(34) S-adenosylmethionine ribosyltransferase-isomerase QueA [Bacilli bacterium]HQA20003.1 tRNA preQ1(34) S-adenosylmethionine ribosyltransferase-isomerase QueA [Bacilli bacterium]HQD92601.1 tRNA preQ1(34) S-adenosylmethionine ribosyltransferase-isomerase QueA [Bacilli bacterium]
MKVEEFDYDLPEELIAQTPLENRAASRLMTVNRKTGEIGHYHFYEIGNFLQPGDVLVLNDTKVLPSRIIGEKVPTKAKIEVLLLQEYTNNQWEALVRPARRVKVGTEINFNNVMSATVIEKFDEGLVKLQFNYDGIFLEKLSQIGQMPLPPYIKSKLNDPDRYQTVYAKHLGSSAAPTAGLHFTEELLESLKQNGIEIVYVTLHVGLGTFRDVKVENVEEHKMHSEYYEMKEEAALALNKAKAEGRRIISVGTTSTRTLESIYQKYNKFVACHDKTDIFIYPGYEFKAIDALITNFHLPKSTLIMLVSAFASKDLIFKAYHEAIKERYRFFSFGDAMFIY